MSKKSVKITKGVLILAVIVIYFVVMGVKNKNNSKSINESILNTVTIVSDGKINAENEGKLVLVTGLISFNEPVSFPELNYKFNTFKAKRVVRDYAKDPDDKDSTLSWIEREEPVAKQQTNLETGDDYYDYSGDYEASDVVKPFYTTDDLATLEVSVPAKVGEFNIDSTGMSLIDASKTLVEKDITVCGLSSNGMYYTNPLHEDAKAGDVSIQYFYYDLSKSNKMSILAKQKGDSFTPYEFPGNKVYKIFGGDVNSKESLSTALENRTKSDFKLRMVFVAIILAIGLLIIRGGKSKNE